MMQAPFSKDLCEPCNSFNDLISSNFSENELIYYYSVSGSGDSPSFCLSNKNETNVINKPSINRVIKIDKGLGVNIDALSKNYE